MGNQETRACDFRISFSSASQCLEKLKGREDYAAWGVRNADGDDQGENFTCRKFTGRCVDQRGLVGPRFGDNLPHYREVSLDGTNEALPQSPNEQRKVWQD